MGSVLRGTFISVFIYFCLYCIPIGCYKSSVSRYAPFLSQNVALGLLRRIVICIVIAIIKTAGKLFCYARGSLNCHNGKRTDGAFVTAGGWR